MFMQSRYVEVTMIVIIFVSSSLGYDWEHHKATYGLLFKSASEENKHQTIFTQNMAAINEHNQKAAVDSTITYLKGPNKLTHLTHDDIISRYTGYIRSKNNKHMQEKATISTVAKVVSNLPTSVDWRNTPLVGPIKDQGNCGL